MKRYIFIFTIFLTLFLTSCSCSCNSRKDPFKDINNLLKKDEESLKIVIDTKKDEINLNSVYFVSKENDKIILDYKIESLNNIDPNSKEIESFIKTETGKISYSKGRKDVIDGRDLHIYIRNINLCKFILSKDIIADFNKTESSFTGTINNPKEYLNIDTESINIVINYDSNNIKDLSLSYLKDGSNVNVKFLVNPK